MSGRGGRPDLGALVSRPGSPARPTFSRAQRVVDRLSEPHGFDPTDRSVETPAPQGGDR